MNAIALKMQHDIVDMNTALIDTLLSLIPTAFKILYEQEQMIDQNIVFCQYFDWFAVKYGCTLAEDHKTDCMAMAADWHPSMGFEVLTSCLFCCITFASLSGNPITNKDTVNIGIHVLNCTGLFTKEYKAWILCGDNARIPMISQLSSHSGKTQSNCGIYLSPCKPAWIWHGNNQQGRSIPHGCGVKL